MRSPRAFSKSLLCRVVDFSKLKQKPFVNAGENLVRQLITDDFFFLLLASLEGRIPRKRNVFLNLVYHVVVQVTPGRPITFENVPTDNIL